MSLPHPPINLQSNYPVLASQEADWKALLHAAVDRFSAESLRLPPFGGWPALREKAAAWLNTDPANTLIAESGHHGLMASLLGAGLTGKTIAVEALTYPWFVKQCQMLNIRVLSAALDAECMVPEALRELCLREQVDAVYTMPSLHNPTSAVASLARREAVVAVAREFNLTIIEDAAYSFLLEQEPPRYHALAPERAFYVESLSKRVAPGLRTAFVVSPPQHAMNTELALRVLASGSSTLLASLGCAMAEDGSLAVIIEAKRREGTARSTRALSILAGADILAAPATTWHLWITRPATDTRTDEQFEQVCEAAGILVTGARWFTAPGAEVPHAVRIGLGGETNADRVEEGLAIFANVLRS
jgi:DNA-binding transcriptional MocR family regulator